MEKISMCRICLVEDVGMHCVINTYLQETYEKLTGMMLELKDGRPLQVCYICCAKLRNCYRLRASCLQSEEAFNQLLNNNSLKPKIFPAKKQLHVTLSPVLHLSIDSTDSSSAGENYSRYDHIRTGSIGIIDDVNVKTELVEEMEDTSGYKEDTIQYIEPKYEIDIDNVCIRKIMLKHNTQTAETSSDHVVVKSDSKPNYVSFVDSKKCGKGNPYSKKKKIVKLKENTRSNHSLQLETEVGNNFNRDIAVANINQTAKKIKYTGYRRNEELTAVKSHQCVTCGKYFKRKRRLVNHMRLHTKVIKCDICGKCFQTKAHLLKHTLTHLGEKPYKCDNCNKTFTTKGYLTTHIRIHCVINVFKCDNCEKSFDTKCNLAKHHRMYCDKNPFKCDICDRSFSQKSGLTVHNRFLHTDKEPYKCNLCSLCFREESSLQNHISEHTEDKPFKCDTCGTRFKFLIALSLHVRTHLLVRPHHSDI